VKVGDNSPGGPIWAKRPEWLGPGAVEMKEKWRRSHDGMSQIDNGLQKTFFEFISKIWVQKPRIPILSKFELSLRYPKFSPGIFGT
jgi:hypothetical protein